MFILDTRRPSMTVECNRTKKLDPVGGIVDEVEWRMRPQLAVSPALPCRVAATRWRTPIMGVAEARAATPDNCYVIGITLRRTNMRFSLGRRVVVDGAVMPGTPLVAAPGTAVRCIFRGPCDELHLHASNEVIAECADKLAEPRPPAWSFDVPPIPHPIVERLARTLLEVEKIDGSVAQFYADCIGIAIIAWLLASSVSSAAHDEPKVAPLPRWRLMRAVDYVQAHLAEPVSLADLAAAAGLTRMYFAAQFRRATGLRPHEYLLRCRIERAQEMLVGTSLSVVDIALSVGFQTQSHFATVFKRFTGQSPYAWQQLTASACHQVRVHARRPPARKVCAPSHSTSPDRGI
jgi:AraC family transcriptional regulator